MSNKIFFDTKDEQTSVLSYELDGLDPKKFYTVAIYQIERKMPSISRLTVNTSSESPGKTQEIFKLAGLKGNARGRRIYIDVYEQKGKIPSSILKSIESREKFDLVGFREKNNLTLIDSGYILYTGTEYRIPQKRTGGHALSEKEKEAYFKKWSELTKKQKSYCRCVLHVAAKNAASCNENRKWGEGACYNPYAVCAKSTGTSVRFCGMNYEWDKIPTSELHAFAELHKMDTTSKTTRKQLLKMLKAKSKEETV